MLLGDLESTTDLFWLQNYKLKRSLFSHVVSDQVIFFLFVVERKQMKSQLGKQFLKPQHWPLWLLVPLLHWGPRGGIRRASRARHKLLTWHSASAGLGEPKGNFAGFEAKSLVKQTWKQQRAVSLRYPEHCSYRECCFKQLFTVQKISWCQDPPCNGLSSQLQPKPVQKCARKHEEGFPPEAREKTEGAQAVRKDYKGTGIAR